MRRSTRPTAACESATGSRTTTGRPCRPRSAASSFLEREPPTEGAHGVALFASEANGLFEAIKLPRPVRNRVAIGRSPLVGPLARLERRERWCVALVSRRDARIFRGSTDGLREIEQIHDTVFGQHDQGGWRSASRAASRRRRTTTSSTSVTP